MGPFDSLFPVPYRGVTKVKDLGSRHVFVLDLGSEILRPFVQTLEASVLPRTHSKGLRQSLSRLESPRGQRL